MSSSLRQWMQSNHVFDKDLLHLFPKYGVNNPEDISKINEDKWAELENVLMNEKRAELKDNASLLRFKKKINKITKIWKEQRKTAKNKNKNKNTEQNKARQTKRKVSIKRRNSSKTKIKTATSISISNDDEKTEQNDIAQLRMENKRLRRELSTKNSDHNRLQQDFNAYKLQKEEELKKLNQKCNMKTDEYNKLFKNYKQINQRINSKYHNKSAKDKEIMSLKTDKSTLLSDINQVMISEQGKYDILLNKYKELKQMNNRNLKYKVRYKKEQNVKRKKRNYNYTVDLNAADISKIQEIDNEYTASDNDNENENEQKQNGFMSEYYRPKKYKPSKEKRARARQLSEILTTPPKNVFT